MEKRKSNKNMKWSHFFVVLIVACTPMTTNAAILDFVNAPCDINFNANTVCDLNQERISQSYGDISGQVNVEYDSNVASPGKTPIAFYLGTYSGLTEVAGGDPGVNAITEIALLPEPGFKVTLNSFDIGSATIISAPLEIGVSVLEVGNPTPLLDTTTPPLSIVTSPGSFTNLNFMSLSGLLIRFEGHNTFTAIDNINFDVSPSPVPTPSAMLLMGTGLLGLIGWNYWRTKQ